MAVNPSSAINAGTAAQAATTPTLTQYLNLSDYVYTSGLSPFSKTLTGEIGFKPLSSGGQVVSKYVESNGFYGEAFISTTGSVKTAVIAFEGTNVHNPPTPGFLAAQIAGDASLFHNSKPASFSTVKSFTNAAIAAALKAGVSRDEIFVTGHSLGAAEAEYAASQYGLAGATFGTVGVSTKYTGDPSKSKLQNYVEQGDPVGNYASNAPGYLGKIVQSPEIQHYGATTIVGDAYHSDLLKAAAQLYDKHTFAGDSAAVGILAFAADEYHPLSTYAKDLGLTLYPEDMTKGTGTTFFAPIVTSDFGLSASQAAVAERIDGHLSELARQLFEGALGHASVANATSAASAMHPDAALAASAIVKPAHG